MFRPTLVAALAYSDGARGGRPPDDPVTMLEVLVLVAPYNVSAARMEYLIRDRPTADGKPQPDIAIPGLLQEHDLDRPRLRRHPQGQGHRRTPAQGCGHQRQHR